MAVGGTAFLVAALLVWNDVGGMARYMARGQWGPLRITLHIREAKVYQILNMIVAQNGSAVWTVLQPPSRMTSRGQSLWQICPLEDLYKQAAIDRLKDLFPSEER